MLKINITKHKLINLIILIKNVFKFFFLERGIVKIFNFNCFFFFFTRINFIKSKMGFKAFFIIYYLLFDN